MMFGISPDAFEVDRTASRWTPYPGFWDHDAERVIQIAQGFERFPDRPDEAYQRA